MNKHILLVMKWLKDPESVSREEVEENRNAAYYAYYAAYAVGANAAKCWVDEYFKRTGEDRQTYINELERS